MKSVPDVGHVPFRRLSIGSSEEVAGILEIVENVIKSGNMIVGFSETPFESQFATVTRRKHCIGVSSGTSALYLALRALGVGPGDDVIIPAISWISTATAVLRCGASPRYVDVSTNGLIEPDAVRKVQSDRTAAVIGVNFFGRLAPWNELEEVCIDLNVPLIEDAAQSAGAILGPRPSGSFGTVSTFSFNPMKVLASIGEAGAVVCDDESIAGRIRAFRYLGSEDMQHCQEPELNHKMDLLQARVLSYQIDRLSQKLQRRREIAMRFNAVIPADISAVHEGPLNETTFFDFPVFVQDSEPFMTFLHQRAIDARLKPGTTLPSQAALNPLSQRGFATADAVAKDTVCLPIFSEMTDREVALVVDALADYFS